MTTSPPNGSRNLEGGVPADVERAAEPPHLGGKDASADPRTVTTGGKIEANGADKPSQVPKDIDPLTGEPFDAYFMGTKFGRSSDTLFLTRTSQQASLKSMRWPSRSSRQTMRRCDGSWGR